VTSGTVFNGSNAFAVTVGDDLVAQMRIPPKTDRHFVEFASDEMYRLTAI